MIDTAATVRPARLALWFTAVAIVQTALLLPFAGMPDDGQRAWFFSIYIAGSSALAVWAASVAPELAANARTAAGRRVLHIVVLIAIAAALAVSAHFADDFRYRPLTLLLTACIIFLASIPFFATLVATLIAEWYLRLPRRPQ